MKPAPRIIVLGALPPLCRPRATDAQLRVVRWLVLAYDDTPRRSGARR